MRARQRSQFERRHQRPPSIADDRNIAPGEIGGVADRGEADAVAPILHFAFHIKPLGIGPGRQDHRACRHAFAVRQRQLKAAITRAGDLRRLLRKVGQRLGRRDDLLELGHDLRAPNDILRLQIAQRKGIVDLAAQFPRKNGSVQFGMETVAGSNQPSRTTADNGDIKLGQNAPPLWHAIYGLVDPAPSRATKPRRLAAPGPD